MVVVGHYVLPTPQALSLLGGGRGHQAQDRIGDGPGILRMRARYRCWIKNLIPEAMPIRDRNDYPGQSTMHHGR